jgi:hypothetical protein
LRPKADTPGPVSEIFFVESDGRIIVRESSAA